MLAGFLALGQAHPSLRSVERLCGKMGFCMLVRSFLRSILQHSYAQLHCARSSSAPRVRWTASLFEGAFMGCMFLPSAEMNLGFRRVFCSDAAPGGPGICYGVAGAAEVRAWCRIAEFRGEFSRLDSTLADLTPEPEAPRPKRFCLPLERMWWRWIGRPGGDRHINLKEARALRWAVAQRSRFRGETNARCLHPVDNASCFGAAAKGRSASFAMDSDMRKIAATQVLASNYTFYVWIASKENPADAPSSRYGSRARGAAQSSERCDTIGLVRRVPMTDGPSILVLERSHGGEPVVATDSVDLR